MLNNAIKLKINEMCKLKNDLNQQITSHIDSIIDRDLTNEYGYYAERYNDIEIIEHHTHTSSEVGVEINITLELNAKSWHGLESESEDCSFSYNSLDNIWVSDVGKCSFNDIEYAIEFVNYILNKLNEGC